MLDKLMMGAKEVKMPEHKQKARLYNIMKLKELAKELLAEELGQKIEPKQMEIEISAEAPEMEMSEESEESEDSDMAEATEMTLDEAMDAPMDKWKEKEATMLKAAMAVEPDMEEMDEEMSDSDKLKEILRKKKEQDSEY